MAQRFAILATCGTAGLLICAMALPHSAVAVASEGLPASKTASKAAAKSSELAAASETPGNLLNAKGPAAQERATSSVTVSQQQPSDAERITQLQRSLETDRKRLAELKASLSNPQEEYPKAEREFKQLNEQLEGLKKRLQKLQAAGKNDEEKTVRTEIDVLTKKWTLAKERFDLAIRGRRATQEVITSLEEKLPKNAEALDALLGNDKPHSPPAPAGATSHNHSPAVEARPALPPPAQENAKATVPTATKPLLGPAAFPQVPTVPLPAPPIVVDATGVSPALPAPVAQARQTPEKSSSDGVPSAVAPTPPKREDKELIQATQTAQKTATDARLAADRVYVVTERMEILKNNIQLERTLRYTALRRLDNAQEWLAGLNEELHKKLIARENTDDLQRQIREAGERLRDAHAETRRLGTHLDELQSELARLQEEQLVSARDAEHKQLASEKAQKQVEQLRNPFTPRNILQWLLDHGFYVIAILVAVAVCLWISRLFERELIRLTAGRGKRGTRQERENRAKTLLGLFRSATNLLVVGGGAVMLLDEIGIPIGPLLGGAAVVGLAVAFGAQSLIKDYFTGFMVILEQQYLINDVIKIGEISGQVERITLRTTVLRDIEGRVHFVPHGQIATVTNLTHGWSNAVFDIGVAYKENVDRVIEVLVDLGKELREAPEFGNLILEDPTMLGVEALGDSAVVVKFFIKTLPLKQWKIRREMLRRIKNKFDELGIEIPFPHRTVFYRREAESQLPGDQWHTHCQAKDAA